MSTINHTRASEADADKACEGRWLAQRLADTMLPDQEPGEDALYGRAVHHALATGDTSRLTAEQVDSYDACQKILAKALQEYFGADAIEASRHAAVEEEFKVKVDDWDHIGHPDKVFRYGAKALIPDFKTLAGTHATSNINQQLRDYVVLVEMNTLMLSEVAVCIIEPLVSHQPNICVYKTNDIVKAQNEMFDRIRKSHDPRSPRTPGTFACTFCSAKKICTEYQRWASGQLPVPRSIVDVPVAQWTKEQRAIFCEHEATARKWLDGTKEEMKRLLKEDPDAIPGFYLKPGNEVEILTDLQTIFNRFTALGGTLDAFMECLRGVKIKGRLEEKIRAVTGQKGMALKTTMKNLTAGASEMAQNEPSLKRKDE